MSRMLLGAFTRPEEANEAVTELEYDGYTPADISVISQHQEYFPQGASKNQNIVRNAATGAITGGALGGLAGMLTGIGLMPVLAGVFVSGPIAAIFGIAGTVATTVSGIVTGAAAGGLIGALVGLGLPHQTAEAYNRVINAGGVVVGLSEPDGMTDQAREVLLRHGASDIGVADVYATEPVRQQEYVVRHEPVFGERIGDDDDWPGL